MKKELLKIAGVKSEKEFYKKFPTEEAFMKVHGKAFKKAQAGQMIGYYTGQGINQASGETKKPKSSIETEIGKYAKPVGQLIQGIQQLNEEKNALKRAQQMEAVSALSLQAARTRPQMEQRRYVRPEDIVGTGEEQFPIYGTGTNPLAKNGTEIANTFAPNTLYDDLGYEPLDDSERLKQFYHGGKMKTADFGAVLGEFANAGGGDFASNLITGIGGENAGGNIGGTIGKTIGNAILPGIGGMVGQVQGQLIGGLINRTPAKTKRAQAATMKNIDTMGMTEGIQGLQGQYGSFMKNGGDVSEYEWISHTWQPQKIVKFGEHNLKDLLKAPKDADMLRAGGHLKEYTPPSERAMSTERPLMQLGGELQTHWGGYAEPMSYNPYLPDGGETVMFRGQSHEESDGRGNTGIGITYGNNPVEVERGEPAVKLRDGGGDSSLVVFGNLKIPKGMLGKEAEGKNFKKYVSELSKIEDKKNKLMDKSVTALDGLEVKTPIDRLTFNALSANVMGSNMKLKELAEQKMDAAALQSAMNDTIEEFGLETTDKGLIKAKKGINIPSAQKGKLVKMEAMKDVPKDQVQGKVYWGGVTDKDFQALKERNPWFNWNNFNPAKKSDVERFQKAFNREAQRLGVDTRLSVDGYLGKQTASAASLYQDVPETTLPDFVGAPVPAKKTSPFAAIDTGKTETVEPISEKETKRGGFPWQTYFNEALPYLRPTDAEELDPNQLTGEMFALATNQLEPVQAQTYRPQLNVPYDISLQDILNENEASFRAQQRILGYNPAAQSMLNAQKYAANQKVLGEQFRMNQAMKDQVYRENRNILNDAQLKNLGILDTQYQRQAAARSATKATTQAALNSIASKYAQNRLENRTLQAYENLYNYRFDPRFRAMNMNPLAQFNIPQVGKVESKETAEKGKMGVKIKKSMNGSIVKALKNI